MKGLLGPYGLTVETATSGQQALELVGSAAAPQYDLIFMDHMMPGMDGLEAVRRIRALGSDYTLSVPIVALTANAVADNKATLLASGFDEFLSKPVDIMHLDAILAKWIRRDRFFHI